MTTMMMEKPVETNECCPSTNRPARQYEPRADIVELPNELQVRLDVPGATAESIDVNFENGLLTIRGQICERQPANTRFLLQEYGVGDFVRSFRIGDAVDTAKVTAECRHGVLTLRLPKTEAVRARRIAVKSS